jgi:hypothetical protein
MQPMTISISMLIVGEAIMHTMHAFHFPPSDSCVAWWRKHTGVKKSSVSRRGGEALPMWNHGKRQIKDVLERSVFLPSSTSSVMMMMMGVWVWVWV